MAHDPLSLCKKMVSIPSESGSEQKIADFIEGTAASAGLRTVRLGNSVAIIPAKPSRSSALILCAHIDTVPPGDEKAWEHPPYAGEIAGGKLYGLGASDDKGAAACILSAAIGMKGKKTAADVYCLFAEGEEKGGYGSAKFAEWFSSSGLKRKYLKAWCVVGEPTGLAKAETGCRGVYFVSITVRGKSYHGADPEKKSDDALSKALAAIGIAEKLQVHGQKKHAHPFLGKPTVSVTGIHAGEKPNKLPDTATVTLDVRTTPSFHGIFLPLLEKELEQAGIAFTLEISPRHPAPYALGADSRLASALCNLTGAKTSPARGSNDCSIFLAAGIEALSFGPGTKECIHRQDEYVPLGQLEKGKKMFVMLAEKLEPK